MSALKKTIPVSEPTLAGNEEKYVLDCLRTNWISSVGPYVEKFEKAFASFCGTKYAIGLINGTAALHTALLGLGVGPGDEVIVPTFTFVASVNAISYCQAKPIFVDCEPDTWNMDVRQVENRISPKTKGIIVVHIFGHPVEMEPVLSLAKKYNLFVLEDAAEAHGAKYKGRRVGAFGEAAAFSFYGNKIITTGEGGMITTDNDALAAKMRIIKGQGMDTKRRYWHPVIGYNYRITNIQAAIGLAQLERIEGLIAIHRKNALTYHHLLEKDSRLTLPVERPWAEHVYWVYGILVDNAHKRDIIMQALEEKGIGTRPFFYPAHIMPAHKENISLPVAQDISARGIILPSSANLTEEDIRYVCRELLAIADRQL